MFRVGFFSAAFGEKISGTFSPNEGKVAVCVFAWTGAQWVKFKMQGQNIALI